MAKKDNWRDPSNVERIKERGYELPEITMMSMEIAEREKIMTGFEIAASGRKPIPKEGVYSNEITEGMVIAAEDGGINKENITTR